jgi:hypothetical protein
LTGAFTDPRKKKKEKEKEKEKNLERTERLANPVTTSYGTRRDKTRSKYYCAATGEKLPK